MARPNKTGLDYFPLDIDFFEDEKITAVSGEFGIKGEITVIRLLCAIYRNGYFILWDDLLKYKILKSLPGIAERLLDGIVQRLVQWGFFDKALFDSAGVLTSKGIQRRYFSATKRRVANADELPYLLVSVCNNPQKTAKSEFLHTKTPFEEEFLHAKTTQSKVKNKEISPCGDTKKNAARFSPPTTMEVESYIAEKGFKVDARRFVDYYTANGWMVGKNRMNDWRAAVRNWERTETEKERNDGNRQQKQENRHRSLEVAAAGPQDYAEPF